MVLFVALPFVLCSFVVFVIEQSRSSVSNKQNTTHEDAYPQNCIRCYLQCSIAVVEHVMNNIVRKLIHAFFYTLILHPFMTFVVLVKYFGNFTHLTKGKKNARNSIVISSSKLAMNEIKVEAQHLCFFHIISE